MAQIKREEGFTAVPNNIMEALFIYNFTSAEFRIILAVIRYTYGFNRDFSGLSLQYLSRATNINKNYVARCLRKLISHGVIVYSQDDRNAPKKLGINKDITQWKNTEGVSQEGYPGVSQEGYPGVSQEGYSGVSQEGYSGVSQDGYQEINNKINNNKDNNKDNKESVYAPEITEVINKFNSVCKAYTPVRITDENIVKKIQRLIDTFSFEEIETGFETAQRSLFLRGEKSGWKANFEWIINLENMSKILNGKYNGEETKSDSDIEKLFQEALRRSEEELYKKYSNDTA